MRLPILCGWCVLSFSTPPATLPPIEHTPPKPPVNITEATIAPTTTIPQYNKPDSRRRDGRFNPDWLATLDVPTDAYWDKVAQCETANNWKDKGLWSGGLGIYLYTWRGFGGQQFADSPNKATREQQIAVANRIAIRGFKYGDYWQEPVGFNGWGCIRTNNYLHPTVDEPWIVEMKND